jgi:hypothetical protein
VLKELGEASKRFIRSLQQNSSLTTTNWVDVTIAPVPLGGEKQVIVTPSASQQYCRLKHP